MTNLKKVSNEIILINAYGRDENAYKHIIHGLCILETGGKPSDPSNFKDYDDAGELEIHKPFIHHSWKRIEKLYPLLTNEDKLAIGHDLMRDDYRDHFIMDQYNGK